MANRAFKDRLPKMHTLFMLSLIGLFVVDLLGLNRDFSRAQRFLKRTPTSNDIYPGEIVAHVCEAVGHASIWYPKQIRCLQRSFVTTMLLRRYGVAAQVAVGVQNIPFKAHAWTEVNEKAINERQDVQKIYSVWERC